MVIRADPEQSYRVAIHFIATEVITQAVEGHAHALRDLYPDIGERDWERIVERARHLTASSGAGADMVRHSCEVLARLAADA